MKSKMLRAIGYAVLAAAIGGCAGAPVTRRVEEDVRLELIEWARLAQSAHNFQTWRVELDAAREDTLHLFLDGSRMLPETDPPARQITMSAGTFLAVVEARAAQLGYRTAVDLLPQGEFTLDDPGGVPVASVRVERSQAPATTLAMAADADAITRPTVKYRYEPAVIDGELAARIEGYSRPGIRFTVIDEPDAVAWLNQLSIDAFTIEMTNEPTLLESFEATRQNGSQRRRDPYGLSYSANFPGRSLWFIDIGLTLAPQRDAQRWGETGIGLFTEAMEQIESYVMVVSDNNDRRTQLETGMLLQAAWMELHAAGLVALPNSQALQEYAAMAEPYRQIHARYAAQGGTVQMLLAVAEPRGGRHRFSPRFPAGDLVAGN